MLSGLGRRLRRLTNRDGFTLAEIIVVLGILLIGIIPLAVLQSRARQEVGKSNRYSQAMMVAQARMEEMKGAGFGNAVADSGQAGQIDWRTAVQNVSFGMDRISVTVTWQHGRQLKSMTLSDLQSMR